ncbi:hypothetical protein PHYBLDRAFT_4394, partial [Phycomyces blakesleeanus NRRL 1555(-)]
LQEYAISVSVGTPPKEFLLVLDTGSSDTWVPSSICTPKAGCPSDRRFNPSESSTYVHTRLDYQAGYLTAQVNGSYFNDTITVGNFTLDNQFLFLVNDQTGSLADQTSDILLDGVFGAGLPGSSTLSNNRNETFLTIPMELYARGLIPEPLFSVFLGQAKESAWSGEIIFGAVDQERAASRITYIDVAQFQAPNGYVYFNNWFSLASQIEVGSNYIEAEEDTSLPFLFDTGTDALVLPTDLADKVVQSLAPDAIKNDTVYNVDCSYLGNTRPFRIIFPGSQFTTVKQSKNLNVTLEVPVNKMVTRLGSTCQLIIETNDDSYPIIGNLFLRHFITVFNFEDYTIGLAP